MNCVQICFPQHIFLHQLFSMQTVCSCCIYLYHSPLLQLFKACGTGNPRAQDLLGLVILLMLSSTHSTVSGPCNPKIADSENESVAGKWKMVKCGNQSMETKVQKRKYRIQSTKVRKKLPIGA